MGRSSVVTGRACDYHTDPVAKLSEPRGNDGVVAERIERCCRGEEVVVRVKVNRTLK